MNSWFSPRVLFAFGLAFVGAVFAGQMLGVAERILIVFVSMLIALFVVAEGQGHDEAVIDTPRSDEPLIIDAASITSHPQLQAFIDASTDAILMVENARVTAANVVALRLLGSNIVGQNVRMAFRHAGAIERLSDPDAQHSGHPIKLTGIGQKNQLWEMRIQMMGPGQKIVHLADRTGTQAAEKMRVDFVANASHELRSPLARMKMALSMLGDVPPEHASRLKEEIHQDIRELNDLVEEVLLASRLDAREADVGTVEEVDLIGLAAEECARVDAHLELGFEPHSIVVPGVVKLLRRLLRNLLENARRYGTSDIEVQLSSLTENNRHWVRLCVCDRGPGVPPDLRERIFEPFYRLPGASEREGGVGLGLSLVRSIVQRHGGSVHCQDREGGGAQFVVMLPVG